MTVVIPLYCNRRWMANAVSLWRTFWNGFSWRITIGPVKNVINRSFIESQIQEPEKTTEFYLSQFNFTCSLNN